MLKNEYPGLVVEYDLIEGVRVSRRECQLIGRIVGEVRDRYSLEGLKDNRIVRAYRDFFWSLGVDPTKVRPASEALARRVLQGRGLPRINTVVDAMNAVSALTLISMSAFDADKIRFPLLLRPASGGEEFVDISGKKFRFVRNFPLLEDSGGAIVAAVPFRDGFRTRVTEETTRVFLMAYAPATIERHLIRKAIKLAKEAILECSKI